MSETIAKEAVALLREKCKTIAVAESCTGGSLCGTLTDVPGVSEVFRYGVAVYANEAKTRELSVPETLIAAHGAVSEEVAVAMAQGVRAKDHADLGLAVTGIAGPGGGTPQKPVGTVWMALCGEHGCITRKLQLPETDSRTAIRAKTVQQALLFLCKTLKTNQNF